MELPNKFSGDAPLSSRPARSQLRPANPPDTTGQRLGTTRKPPGAAGQPRVTMFASTPVGGAFFPVCMGVLVVLFAATFSDEPSQPASPQLIPCDIQTRQTCQRPRAQNSAGDTCTPRGADACAKACVDEADMPTSPQARAWTRQTWPRIRTRASHCGAHTFANACVDEADMPTSP